MFTIKQELRFDTQKLLGQVVVFKTLDSPVEEVGYVAKATTHDITILCRRIVDTGIYEAQALRTEESYVVIDTISIPVQKIKHSVNENLNDVSAVEITILSQESILQRGISPIEDLNKHTLPEVTPTEKDESVSESIIKAPALTNAGHRLHTGI